MILFVISLIFDSVSWFLFGGLPYYSQSKPFRTQIWSGRSLCFKSPFKLSFHSSWHKGKLHICAKEHSNSPAQSQTPLTLVVWILPCFAAAVSLIIRRPCQGRITPIVNPYRHMHLSCTAFVTAAVWQWGVSWHLVYLLVYLLLAPAYDLKYRSAFITILFCIIICSLQIMNFVRLGIGSHLVRCYWRRFIDYGHI